jgi:RNA polymerase sigma factor (sigma-70 family)
MPGLLVYKADSRIKDHHRRIARLTQLDPAKHDRADRLNMDQRIDHKTALAAIPDDERYIFILCFREGLTQEEVAARLAVSTRTVRRKLDAALTHVQGFLRGETADPGTIAV